MTINDLHPIKKLCEKKQPKMKYNPHDYQKYAIGYIEKHPISAIFLDCGLGKTSITLTAIADLLFDSFEVHRVLVKFTDAETEERMRSENLYSELGIKRKVDK